MVFRIAGGTSLLLVLVFERYIDGNTKIKKHHTNPTHAIS